MLSKRYKLSRRLFPLRSEARSLFVGGALRIQAYVPTFLGQKQKKNESISPRFAVVVAKKWSAGAAKRNVFKREVMAAIERHIAFFLQLSFHKYVIFPKKPVHLVTRENIEEDIRAFLSAKKRL